MTQTIQQAIEANKLELERLHSIYIKVNDYAKQLSGMSILDLESLIEEAERFDSAFNSDNLEVDTFYYE
jgi:hypothetical protein